MFYFFFEVKIEITFLRSSVDKEKYSQCSVDISSEVQQIGGRLSVRKRKKAGISCTIGKISGLIEIHTRHYRRFADGNRTLPRNRIFVPFNGTPVHTFRRELPATLLTSQPFLPPLLFPSLIFRNKKNFAILILERTINFANIPRTSFNASLEGTFFN